MKNAECEKKSPRDPKKFVHTPNVGILFDMAAASKSIVVRALIFCGVIGAFICIKVLPGFFARRAEHQAASQVANEAARDAAQRAVNDVVHDAVKQKAAEILRDVVGSENPSTAPAATNPGDTVIERTGYRITLPGNSTVDPPDANVGKDRLTQVNLPDHGALIIVAVDDKTLAAPEFDKMAASLQAKLESASIAKAGTFDGVKAARSTAISGTVKGERFAYEIAQIEGQKKACLIVLEYPEENKAATIGIMQKALATFQIRE
ncbi:MAG: hypothetical protein JWP03_4322 [Phycisphaerales bacterium]|nr:hypothetical protein [Phycisphaerales bacterium]